MTALAAAVFAPTLAEALDESLVLALAGAQAHCLWCGSRGVACSECGAELVSDRGFSPVGRRP